MNEEVKLIEYEIAASTLFIGTIIVSIILSYNNKLKTEKKEPLFDEKTEKQIIIINRIIVLLIVIFLFYINYENYKLAEFKHEDTTPLKAQLIPSILGIIGALYVLSLSIGGNNNDIALNENPDF